MEKSRFRIILFSFAVFLLLVSPILSGVEPFLKDADHDGFPDDLETATGYNPRVNEALKRSSAGGKCGVLKTDLMKIGRPNNILIILDISGSMSEPMDASNKMEVAKKILGRYIDALPDSARAALVVYGRSGCDEDSIALLSPIGRINRDSLKSKIMELRPSGATPIAFTLSKTAEFLKGFEEDNNSLILVSDGMESCGADPIKAILDLKEGEANPEVMVIGLKVNAATRAQLAKIAASSDGVYEDVKTEGDFVRAFAGFFNKMNRFYKDILCIVAQYNAYLTYETEQYNKSKAYLVKAMTKAMSDAAREAVSRTEARIDKNHSARIAAKEKLGEMIKNKMDDMAAATERFVGAR